MPALWLMISSVGYQANPTCPVANPGTVSLLRINIIRGNMCPVTIRGYLRPVAIRGYLRPVAIRGYRCPVTLTTREKTQACLHLTFFIIIHSISIHIINPHCYQISNINLEQVGRTTTLTTTQVHTSHFNIFHYYPFNTFIH